MFYDRYVNLCKENKVSPSKAAEDNGLSRTSVVKWKKGAIPSGATVQKLAAYFGVTADYLFGNVNEPFFYLDNEKILKEINSYEDEPIEKEQTPAPAKEDEREITFDDFTYALHNEAKALSEDDKQILLQMAKMLNERTKENKSGGKHHDKAD